MVFPEYRWSRFNILEPLDRDRLALFNTLTQALVIISEDWHQEIIHQTGYGSDFSEFKSQGFLVPRGSDENRLLELNRLSQIFDRKECRAVVRVGAGPAPGGWDGGREVMALGVAREVVEFLTRQMEGSGVFPLRLEVTGGERCGEVTEYLVEGLSRFCRGKGSPLEVVLALDLVSVTAEDILRLVPYGLKRVRLLGRGIFGGPEYPRPVPEQAWSRIAANISAAAGLVKVEIGGPLDLSGEGGHRFQRLFSGPGNPSRDLSGLCFFPGSGTEPPGPDPFLAPSCCSAAMDLEFWLKTVQAAVDLGLSLPDRVPRITCPANTRKSFFIDHRGIITACPAEPAGSSRPALGRVGRGKEEFREAVLVCRKLPQVCLSACALAPLCDGGCRYRALALQGTFDGVFCQQSHLEAWIRAHVRRRARTWFPAPLSEPR